MSRKLSASDRGIESVKQSGLVRTRSVAIRAGRNDNTKSGAHSSCDTMHLVNSSRWQRSEWRCNCDRISREQENANWTKADRSRQTYLVVDLAGSVLEINGLLENVALLLELDTLGPVVKCARDVDLLGGVFPVRPPVSLRAGTQRRKGGRQAKRGAARALG